MQFCWSVFWYAALREDSKINFSISKGLFTAYLLMTFTHELSPNTHLLKLLNLFLQILWHKATYWLLCMLHLLAPSCHIHQTSFYRSAIVSFYYATPLSIGTRRKILNNLGPVQMVSSVQQTVLLTLLSSQLWRKSLWRRMSCVSKRCTKTCFWIHSAHVFADNTRKKLLPT